MNPAMMNFLQSQQAQEQPQGAPPLPQFSPESQMPEEGYNPFKNGAQAALEAIRQSSRPSEDDERRAMGRGLMEFFTRMAQPTGIEGFDGTLAAANNSFLPAYDAYDKHLQRSQAERASILEALEKQQLHQALEQQKMQQHFMEMEEKGRQHSENLAYKRAHDQDALNLRREEIGDKRSYQNQKLSLQEQSMIKKIEEAKAQGKPVPSHIINKISKELEHLEAAENEYKNYEVAKELLEKGDPLFNPIAEGFFNLPLVGGRPEAFMNPDQALFKEMAGDTKGQIGERLGFKTDASRKTIETFDPKKSKKANLKIIEQSLNRIKPLVEKKKKYQALMDRIIAGENPNVEEIMGQQTSESPQVPLMEVERIEVVKPDGQRVMLRKDQVQKALQKGWKTS